MSEKELSCIVDDTGYQEVKTFRTIFKRFTGLSPIEYKKVGKGTITYTLFDLVLC